MAKKALDVAVAVLLGGIMLLTAFQVLSRFVLFLPAPWVEELISLLFVWMIFLGAASAQVDREHTRVELIALAGEGRLLKAVTAFGDLLVVVFLAVVIVFGVELVRATMTMNSQILKFPMGLFYLSAPAGSLAMALVTLRSIYRRASIVRS